MVRWLSRSSSSSNIFIDEEMQQRREYIGEMEVSVKKYVWFLWCLIVVVGVIAGVQSVEGAGECGRVPADRMAIKLAPCASATQNPRAKVSASCCAEVQKMGRNPRCLCAVMLSNTAKNAGVKPAIAMTIPKRCNIANRPVGYKCGGYTLP